jgi:hypothetical protein
MMNMGDLPEIETTVKDLADSGIYDIPAIYIRAPREQPSSPPPPTATGLVPIISLSRFQSDKPQIVRQIRDACTDWGIFQVHTHRHAVLSIRVRACIFRSQGEARALLISRSTSSRPDLHLISSHLIWLLIGSRLLDD